jgi:hypothetical protein
MIDAWIRLGPYVPSSELLTSLPKNLGSVLELFAGMICFFLGVWLFSANSNSD